MCCKRRAHRSALIVLQEAAHTTEHSGTVARRTHVLQDDALCRQAVQRGRDEVFVVVPGGVVTCSQTTRMNELFVHHITHANARESTPATTTRATPVISRRKDT